MIPTIDKVADFIVAACGVADGVVSVLYLFAGRVYPALYWGAAALIAFSILKGLK